MIHANAVFRESAARLSSDRPAPTPRLFGAERRCEAAGRAGQVSTAGVEALPALKAPDGVRPGATRDRVLASQTHNLLAAPGRGATRSGAERSLRASAATAPLQSAELAAPPGRARPNPSPTPLPPSPAAFDNPDPDALSQTPRGPGQSSVRAADSTPKLTTLAPARPSPAYGLRRKSPTNPPAPTISSRLWSPASSRPTSAFQELFESHRLRTARTCSSIADTAHETAALATLLAHQPGVALRAFVNRVRLAWHSRR
jgi:hypothetical protein